MSWPGSIGVAAVSGLVGLLLAGLIANACVDWYRVSSFEGKAGFFVVFVALAGGLAAAAIGLVTARVVAVGAELTWLKTSGLALGVTVGVSGIATLLCWLAADIAPTLDGKELEVELEVRGPRGFSLPEPDEYGASAGVYLPGGRRLPTVQLRASDFTSVDGQLHLRVSVPLTTSAAQKFMQLRLNAQHNLLFSLPLRSRPRAEDCEWSTWVESGWDANQPEPPKEARFTARYRVRVVEPPPPEPDAESVRAQQFAALPSDAPLATWLPYLFESPNAERTKVVVQQINAKQAELVALIRGDDDKRREQALRSVAYVEAPLAELTDAVLAEGRAIADGIRAFNSLPETDASFRSTPQRLSSRFNTWKHAWWLLHHKLGLDGRPPVREIHDLALVRAKDSGMSEIEVNARAILDALNPPQEEKKP